MMFCSVSSARRATIPALLICLSFLSCPLKAAVVLSPDANWSPKLGGPGDGGGRSLEAPVASRLLRQQAHIGALEGFKAEEGPLAAALAAIRYALAGELLQAERALQASGRTDLPNQERAIAQALIYRERQQLSEAADLMDSVLNKDPDHAYAQNLRGTITYRMNGAEAALPYFTAAAEAGPKGATYWSNLAAVLIETGQRQAGHKALAHAVDLAPPACPTLLALASIESGEGNPASAAERYKACLQSEPENTEAATGLVDALLETGRIEEARQAVDRHRTVLKDADLLSVEIGLREGDLARVEREIGLVANQDNLRAQRAKARLNLALGETRLAEGALQRTLELDPADPVARVGAYALALSQGRQAAGPASGGQFQNVDALYRGLSLLAAGAPDPEAVRKAFALGEGALNRFRSVGLTDKDLTEDIPPQAARALAIPLFLQMTSTRGRTAEMLADLSKDNSSSAVVSFLQAEALLSEARDVPGALNALDKALSRNERFLAAHLLRADIALQQGDFKAALKSYGTAAGILPEPQTLLRTGVLAEQIGELDTAEAALRHFAQIAPKNYIALNQLAWFLVSRRGDAAALTEGRKLAAAALELKPGNAAILDTLGWAAYKHGDLEEALDLLKQAVTAAQGRSPEIVLHFVEISLQAGQMDLARAALRPLYAEKDKSPLKEQIAVLAEKAELESAN